jgi:hypothetical protein
MGTDEDPQAKHSQAGDCLLAAIVAREPRLIGALRQENQPSSSRGSKQLASAFVCFVRAWSGITQGADAILSFVLSVAALPSYSLQQRIDV